MSAKDSVEQPQLRWATDQTGIIRWAGGLTGISLWDKSCSGGERKGGAQWSRGRNSSGKHLEARRQKFECSANELTV
jgi:hypothetical protein